MSSNIEYHKFVKYISGFSRDIIKQSLLSWGKIDFTQNEPEIIKSYLLDSNIGVDYLNKNLSLQLSNSKYEVKFASVFIHQKPRIKREQTSISLCKGDTPSCELGDLLVVFCLLDKNKSVIYSSAVISQAKKGMELSSSSQQCLYDSDIKFFMPKNIYSQSKINSKERFLPDYSQMRTKALNYLILTKPLPFNVQIPWSSSILYCWGTFMNRIFSGDVGLSFDCQSVNSPDWNCIISDLLNVGSQTILNKIKRGNNVLNNIVNLFNDFNEYEEYSLEINDFNGVPMMFIIVRDKEFEK